MSGPPKYDFSPGTSITAAQVKYVITDVLEDGFSATISKTGAPTFLSHAWMAEQCAAPGTRIVDISTAAMQSRARLDGASSYLALSKSAQQVAENKAMLALALEDLQEALRVETKCPSLRLTARLLEKKHIRQRLLNIVNPMLTEKFTLRPKGGDKINARQLYSGRVLARLLDVAKGRQEGGSIFERCAPLFHRRGNSGDRLEPETREILHEAWLEAGRPTPGASIANMRQAARRLISQSNVQNGYSGKDMLKLPSHKTMTRHVESMSPLARAIARDGIDHTVNNMSPGRADVPALIIGEFCQADECKLSLVSRAKKSAIWADLSPIEKERLQSIEDEIRARFILAVALDVSSGHVVAWTLSLRTGSEQLIELLRMATRGQAREKLIHGCQSDPMPPMGIRLMRIDNASTLRNVSTITRAAEAGITIQAARASRPTDKAFVERRFRTIEDELARTLFGYTGNRPGALKGVDPFKEGVINIGVLSGILARYFMDIYPNTLRNAVGYGEHLPALRRQGLAETYGYVKPIDPVRRRYALGWKYEVTPTKMGVRMPGGIWFNSARLQADWQETHPKSEKVPFFIDPHDLSAATVILPGSEEMIEVPLATTFFAGMSAEEALLHLQQYRFMFPADRAFLEDHAVKSIAMNWQVVQEHMRDHERLSSFITQDDYEQKASAITRGIDMDLGQIPDTAQPGALTSFGPEAAARPISGDDDLIEGSVADPRVVKAGSTSRKRSLPAEGVQFAVPDKTKNLE